MIKIMGVMWLFLAPAVNAQDKGIFSLEELTADDFKLNQGKIYFYINATGQGQQLNGFDNNAGIEDLAAQSKEFLNAGEGLSLNLQLNDQRNNQYGTKKIQKEVIA